MLESGNFNEHNQYIPKHPRFKYKNKKNNKIPRQLDTLNIYRLHYSSHLGKEIFPNDTFDSLNDWSQDIPYLKFYPNGRCASFSVLSPDSLGKSNISLIQNKDLDPTTGNFSKDYYYFKNFKSFKIEKFLRGDGFGIYIYIMDNYLNKTGDTIIKQYRNKIEVYVKEPLPKHWKKYPVDW